MKRFISTWNRTSLIKRIAIGVVIGAVLGLLVPKFTVIGLLGDMFVGGFWSLPWLPMPFPKREKVNKAT